MNRLLTLLPAGVLVAACFAAAPVPAEDSQKIVFLSDNGPIVIELKVAIDGKPFRKAYHEFMKGLFDSLDKDGDGVLSTKEAQSAPAPAILARPAGSFGNVGGGGAAKIDADGDDKITRQELTTYYQKNGLAPFGLSFGPRQTSVVVLNNLGKENASADAINARLFQLLDTDRDGKLTKQELQRASAILGKFDENEDETLTIGELQVPTTDSIYFQVNEAASPYSLNRPFHLVPESNFSRELGKALLSGYGKERAEYVTREEINLSVECFKRLDRDENGLLDVEELAHLGSLPPDASFTVRLGERAEKEPIVAFHKASDSVKVTSSEEGVVLNVGKARLELCGPQRDPYSINLNFNAREQYVTQFRMADTDNNGYLDKAEAEKSPFLRGLFSLMDADGDGMLFEKEMLTYLDGVESLRKQAGKSCLTLTVIDDDQGLFERLDLDGDGRLSVRELRQADQLLDKLDDNRDNALSPNEVPRRYKGAFDLGASSSGTGSRAIVVVQGTMNEATAPPVKTKGSLWFRKMDRNRDGDVSRGEWLGTEAEFREIDTDGDDLISAEEAERYDQAKRAKEE